MKVTLNSATLPLAAYHHGQDRHCTIEEYLIYCARVSSDQRANSSTAPRLLRYLIEHKHWSPFEMVSFGIEIETSRAIAQQLLRHRSFSFQEFSQRYKDPVGYEGIELRWKARTNRQSSEQALSPENELYQGIDYLLAQLFEKYNQLVDKDVARECARMLLPLCTTTTVVMHGTLRSWIHFFEQRCSPHAQLEIQDIAYEARKLLSDECPWTAEALGWIDADGRQVR